MAAASGRMAYCLCYLGMFVWLQAVEGWLTANVTKECLCGCRQWKDGLLPILLRKLCVDEAETPSDSTSMKVLLMDGQVTLL